LLPEKEEKKKGKQKRIPPMFVAEPMRASNSFVGTEEYIAPVSLSLFVFVFFFNLRVYGLVLPSFYSLSSLSIVSVCFCEQLAELASTLSPPPSSRDSCREDSKKLCTFATFRRLSLELDILVQLTGGPLVNVLFLFHTMNLSFG
jgi:hypothetical protein